METDEMNAPSGEAFFDAPNNKKRLEQCIERLKAIQSTRSAAEGQTDESLWFIPTLIRMITLLIKYSKDFDEHTSCNVEWIGNSFLDRTEAAHDKNERIKEDLEDIFTAAYRFIEEFKFSAPDLHIPVSIELNRSIREIEDFVQANIQKFSRTALEQIKFGNEKMTVAILKRLFHDPSIVAFRDFSQKINEAREAKQAWEKDLAEREARLNRLADNVKKLTASYNFVGLTKGFKELRDNKSVEQDKLVGYLLWLGSAMVTIPALYFLWSLTHLDVLGEKPNRLYFYLPSLVAVELLLLYFYRVILGQYRSVKAQLLQIDLRVSLCQFIESYVEYASTIRKNSPDLLKSFESLIFSNIVADDGQIPSTLDGLDQITKLIGNIKGK
jgi:hypothetical protein